MEINSTTNERKKTIFSKISDYIFNPKVFFEENKEKSKVLIPMLLIVISAAFLQSVTMSIVTGNEDAMKELGENGVAVLNKLSILYGLFVGGIGSIISQLIVALIIFACFKFILNGSMTYKNILSVYCFASLPNVLLNIINIIVYKTNNNISTSLTSILIKTINPFTFWSFILLIIGAAVVSSVSIKKSVTIFVVLAFISIGVTLAGYYLSNISTELTNQIPNSNFQVQ
ncbi:MAG: YIP1 family protein [Clostridiales bacterium]|nr:YIP1 family protein [Clostridiales bacterium]